MAKIILVILAFSFSGCAFYQKDFISKIYLEGKNYPGGDEGQFYIDNDPLIRISFSCYKRTRLAETVFPLIPIPSFNTLKPHGSVSGQRFTMGLEYDESIDITSSTLSASVIIQDKIHPLVLGGVEQISTIIPRFRYRYMSNLKCGDIQGGSLHIRLNEKKEREYGIYFKEEVNREVRYHLLFVT